MDILYAITEGVVIASPLLIACLALFIAISDKGVMQDLLMCFEEILEEIKESKDGK